MITKLKNHRGQWGLFLALCLVGLLLFIGLSAMLTNTRSDTAPVVLDGRQIIKVHSAGNYTAPLRAQIIKSNLEEVISSSTSVRVTIKEENQFPTIVANDSYLLTVTPEDVFPGGTREEQAEIWTQKIQVSLNKAIEERSPEYTRKATLVSMGIVLAAIALQWLVRFLWRRYFHQALERLLGRIPAFSEASETNNNLTVSPNFIPWAVTTCLWGATIFYVIDQFPMTRQFSYRLAGTLVSTLTKPIINLGENSYSIPDLIILIIMLWGLVVGVGAATNIFRSRVLAATSINRGAQEAVAVMAKYGLISIGIIVLLQVWGLDLSSLTILASAFGVGIGLGFQDIAKNFASGIVILFERPIQVGDFVEVGKYLGSVERIGARSTVIRTLDRVSIIVPNSSFLEAELINWDHYNSISGLRLPVGVAYGSNIEAVKKALLDGAAAVYPDVLKVPPPQVLFLGFGNSSLDFELRIWIAQPNKQVMIKSELYFKIEALFRERKIEIPFPQRDLHLRSGQMPVGLSPEVEAMLRQFFQQQANGEIVDSKKVTYEKSDLDPRQL
ncbi:MAG: mechanosensitive ion channel [Cyanobacteriota bacterium]|nr:mechanosensitive ion channel [Cyanobacteriota bacterium]